MKAKLLNLLKGGSNKNLGREGVAALPTILLVGGIIMVVSISLTTSVYLYINSIQGANLGLRALAVARSGAYDGLMRVVRDKSLSGQEYIFSINGQSANVVICGEACVGAGKFKITSVGSALTRRKKIEAVASVNPVTGLVKLESMLEVAL